MATARISEGIWRTRSVLQSIMERNEVYSATLPVSTLHSVGW
jgi:hypothetical protein